MADQFRDLAWGGMDALSTMLYNERGRQREAEDSDIEYQKHLIESLINREDFNPAHIGRAMHDLMNLSGAKGNRKPKKGVAGLRGETEIPLSDLLTGLSQGMTPMYDAPKPQLPTEAAGIQKPQVMTPGFKAGMDLGPGMGSVGSPGEFLDPGQSARAQGFTGQSALSEPVAAPPDGIPVPPEGTRLAGAARDMQKWQTRPPALLRSPEDMAQQEGRSEAIKYGARTQGVRDAEDEEMFSLGATKDEVRQARLRKMTGAQGMRTFARQTHNVLYPGQTQPVSVQFDPSTGQYYAADGVTPITLPADVHRVSTGPTVQHRFFTQPDGSIIDIDASPYMQGINGVENTGVQGRVQFAPQTTIQGFDPNTGLNTTTIVPRPPVPTRPIGNGTSIGAVIPPPPVGASSGLGSPQGGAQASTGQPRRPVTPPTNSTIQVGRGPAGGTTFSFMKPPLVDESARRTMTSVRVAKNLAQDIISFIEQRHLQNDNNKIDALLQTIPYKYGISPGDMEGLIQNLGIQEVNQLSAYMGGQRGQYWTNILQQHTAQPGNTYKLIYQKAHNMLKYDTELEHELNQILLSRPTTNGFQVPQLGGGAPAPAPAQGLPAPGSKGPVSRIMIQKYADEHGIRFNDAERMFVTRGYTVQ